MTACIICGIEFTPSHRNQYTCSPECRRKNKNRLNKQWKQKHSSNEQFSFPKEGERVFPKYKIVEPHCDTYSPGAEFSVEEVKWMLRFGYLSPGMILAKNSKQYLVNGAEFSQQRLVKL